MFAAASKHPSRRHQQGWAGLIVLLIALLIVAWLGKTVLSRLMPAATTTHASGGRLPASTAPADVDINSRSPVPLNELERAKNLEASVKAQAADMDKRIDQGTQ